MMSLEDRTDARQYAAWVLFICSTETTWDALLPESDLADEAAFFFRCKIARDIKQVAPIVDASVFDALEHLEQIPLRLPLRRTVQRLQLLMESKEQATGRTEATEANFISRDAAQPRHLHPSRWPRFRPTGEPDHARDRSLPVSEIVKYFHMLRSDDHDLPLLKAFATMPAANIRDLLLNV